MRNFKPDRAHFINDTMTEQRDEQSTAVAYLGDTHGGKPFAVMFSGKRQKPDSNYRYASTERRAAAIAEHFDNVRRREAYQAERRETIKTARKADASLEFAGKDYLPAPAVAALLRQCLKEAFPGQRFSVTSDGSLNVRWTDGPTAEQVERIAGTFAGSYFDGMIDYRGSLYHSLDGRRVSFGCDFVFCSRDFSRDALDMGAGAICAHFNSNQAPATIEGDGPYWKVTANPDFSGACPGQFPGEVRLMLPPNDASGWQSGEARHALGAWYIHARPVEVQPSPTFQRVAVLGSDGYGNTIDTPEGKPAGAGYAQFERDDMAKARAEREADQPQSLAGADCGSGYPTQDAAAGYRTPDEVDQPPATVAELAQLGDLVEQLLHAVRSREAEAIAEAVASVPRAACEVIDFAPHLLARADAARRVN
jgi:hypothetical protein